MHKITLKTLTNVKLQNFLIQNFWKAHNKIYFKMVVNHYGSSEYQLLSTWIFGCLPIKYKWFLDHLDHEKFENSTRMTMLQA